MNEPAFKLEEGHKVDYVFSSGETNYFKIRDISNTFSHRALEARAVYDEIEMRCDVNYLNAFVIAMKENMRSQLNIPELYKLVSSLEERINFIVPTPDLIWKLASVAYFDESESPYGYDAEYAKEKIEKWKADKSLDTVFFLKSIKNLIPSLDTSVIDSPAYLKIQAMIADKQLEHLLSVPSLKGQRADIYTELNYQKNLIKTLPIAQS
jgi:hypothetical protein